MNRRLIFNLTGAVLLVESAMMLISFVISLALHSGDHWPLLLSAGITLAFGGGFRLIHPATDHLGACVHLRGAALLPFRRDPQFLRRGV